jgi:hypothetical protein
MRCHDRAERGITGHGVPSIPAAEPDARLAATYLEDVPALPVGRCAFSAETAYEIVRKAFPRKRCRHGGQKHEVSGLHLSATDADIRPKDGDV